MRCDDFDTEEPTQPEAYVSLQETAKKWHEELKRGNNSYASETPAIQLH